MNEQTLVAIYKTQAHADAAASDLKAAGIPADAIAQHAKNVTGHNEPGHASYEHEQGFWSRLFGGEPDHDTSGYDRSIAEGGIVLTVKVAADHVDHASDILEKHHPVDMEEHGAAGDRTTTTTTTREGAMQGHDGLHSAETKPGLGTTETLHLAEERLTVGKRAVSGGTTRIRRYVVETPVEENVSLHSEKVTMERHPVTGGARIDNADFTDRTIEMTESNEEVVVGKTAHLKEEISLRKEASDRTETVRDTVRHDEVEIEQVAGESRERAAAPRRV